MTTDDTRVQKRLIALVCLTLAIITFAVYWPVHANDFINYDDNLYVTDNSHVLHGLNWSDARWAFTTGHTGYSHPLTWLTHQIDYQLYGLWAGGHHLTNLALHIVNSVLLFLLFWRMTHAVWQGAFIAAVFAIHPLHVESVAWISERKDLLCSLFLMLTLHAYVRYTEKPGPWRYLLTLLFFALGLISKPMIVTLPCLLLLLDYWPLRRMNFGLSSPEPGRTRTLGWLILEKTPLIVMAAAWSVITFLIVKRFGIVIEGTHLGIGPRAANAVVSYAIYLVETFAPRKLAVLYPYPGSWPWTVIAASAAILLLISAVCLAKNKSAPYMIVGWLWYLGMLVPVIGLVQAGLHARADRYTYLPQIGLGIMAAWGIADLSPSWPRRREILSIAAAIIVGALMWFTRTQLSYWQDSESIWAHTVAVTSRNEVAHDHLGVALTKKERLEEAVGQFEAALRIKPAYADAHNNLGIALAKENDGDDALTHFQKAVQIKPEHPTAYFNIGNIFFSKGELDRAITAYRRQLEVRPDYAEARYSLASTLLQKGRLNEAMTEYRELLKLKPDDAEAHYNLGNDLLHKGRLDEAIAHFETAVQSRPDNADAHNNLAVALFQKGQIKEAIEHWQNGLTIQPNNADAHNNLAVAFLQSGRAKEAVEQWQQSLAMHPQNAQIRLSLAWVLATSSDQTVRDGAKAIELAQAAIRVSGDRNPMAFRTLAAAFAESSQFSEAIEAAKRGMQSAGDQGNSALAHALQSDIALYQSHAQLRDASTSAR